MEAACHEAMAPWHPLRSVAPARLHPVIWISVNILLHFFFLAEVFKNELQTL